MIERKQQMKKQLMTGGKGNCFAMKWLKILFDEMNNRNKVGIQQLKIMVGGGGI